jgi:DNA (cytosine-5)-methyltransferase 1
MIGMTLCSGIGAPEVAAPWIDWRLAAEIEPFPRAVLQKRFGYKKPEDHNQGDPLLWGDMTEVTPELMRSRGVPLPDILVAGTPCQAFSIAGLRKGTEDARGNLTLKFVEICHAIVDARPDGKLAVLWENVPGVLSDKGNAFGCFLGGLVGADDPLLPSPKPKAGKTTSFWKWIKAGKVAIEDDDGNPTDEFEVVTAHHRCKWPSEGMVQGPRARIAWRVLDAQYFGVAQRRRRVFVVVDFGNCIDPAAVLFERKGMQGNTAPRRETGEGASRGFETGPHGGRFTELAPTLDVSCKDGPVRAQIGAGVMSARMTAIGEYTDDDTASSLKARDYKDATDLVTHAQSLAVRRITPTECARLQGFSDDHCDITYRNKPAADGPKFKAFGNSMAVPNIARLMNRMKISMEQEA